MALRIAGERGWTLGREVGWQMRARPALLSRHPAPGSSRVKLASGAGAAIGPQSGVRTGEFLVALDVVTRTRRGSADDPDDLVRIASRIEREWLEPTGREIAHRFDEVGGVVKAVEISRYGELVLHERPATLDPAAAAGLLVDAWLARGPDEEDAQLVRRLKFSGIDVDPAAMVHSLALEARSLDAISLRRALAAEMLRALDRDAPAALRIPSGRSVRLEYTEDGGVTAAVRLQELFGWSETPRIGSRRVRVLLALLAPNGRPVQMTRDLRGFWERTYREVRQELRARYPRHPWPEDPSSAVPAARSGQAGPLRRRR